MATGGEANEGRQEAEVAGLREQFPGRCRVMSQVGQHSHVVTLQPLDRDATIKFLLKESYPDSPPDVVVRSASLGAEQVRRLEQELREGAGSRLGRPMLAELLALAEAWLSQPGIEPHTPASPGKVVTDKKKRFKKAKWKEEEEPQECESKLPSMRTADDVIKRIQWDDNLEQDDFLVGYLDRFRGLVEKYFSAFSWEDLASVDYTVLAIPHHRIQYFKYRGVVVWDKPSRLDLVFGSTGSKVTITDVIQDYEAFAQKQGVDPAAKHKGTGTTAPRNADSDDSDNSDEDGIRVTVRGRMGIRGGVTEGVKKSNRQQDSEGKRWPTHFLSVRITEEEVVQRVQEVQEHLVAQQPHYADCIMAPAALHVTLCMLGLDTPQEVARACSLLQELRQDWRKRCPRQPLVFQGVSTFSKQVLFARVREDPALLQLVEHIKDCLARAGVETRDSQKFTPHLTIMKMSSPVAKQLHSSKEVDPRLYRRFSDLHFGSQPLDKILLCSMGGERGDDGFYVRAAEISLSD